MIHFKNMAFVLFALVFVTAGQRAQAAVWTTSPGRTWTPADEKLYAEFMSKKVGPLFF